MKLRVVWIYFILFAAVSTGTRAVLMLCSLGEIDRSAAGLFSIYAAGLFYDTVTFSYFIIPISACLAFIPEKLLGWKLYRPALYAFTAGTVTVLIFNAFSEYFFWDEFGSRYNFIAVDYLVYTNEVIGNIRESYPLPAIFSAIGIISAAVFFFIKRPLDRACAGTGSCRRRALSGLALLAPALASYCFVDLSTADASPNRYNRSLAYNGIYTLFNAFRENKLDYLKFYPTGNDAAVLQRIRRLLKTENTVFSDADTGSSGIRRLIKNNGGTEKNCNVILIMVESLSAEYLGAFGSPAGLTPNLDALAAGGTLFTNLYATGTRTVRGMEAVVVSVPPTPGRSIVKRPHNEHLFTMGAVFKSRGYENKFIYGGHGYFDNMNYFFRNNDFQAVDRTDFSDREVTFENIWGVCDENLLSRVAREADRSYRANKNFFSFVMTTSNHRPFTFPGGKIQVPEHVKHRNRKRGVKYTDYAIGEFFKLARTKPWFDNTLFVIVADHCAHSAGKNDISVARHKIPLILYAPGMLPTPRKIDTLASQIDIGPTIFDLLNWQYESRFLGRSILTMPPSEGRAFLSNYQHMGYLAGGMLVVLQPVNKIKSYSLAASTSELTEAAAPKEAVQDAIAYYQTASRMLALRQ